MAGLFIPLVLQDAYKTQVPPLPLKSHMTPKPRNLKQHNIYRRDQLPEVALLSDGTQHTLTASVSPVALACAEVLRRGTGHQQRLGGYQPVV